MSAHHASRAFRWRSFAADVVLFTSVLSAAGVATGCTVVLWAHAAEWSGVLSGFLVQALACWWWLTRVAPPGQWGERQTRRVEAP